MHFNELKQLSSIAFLSVIIPVTWYFPEIVLCAMLCDVNSFKHHIFV